MATYIAGMTDYIPQVQPFQPDLNFYGNVLQTKQTKYDAAHKQLSGIYGSLLNSPLTRSDNIQKREEMFKMIDEDIKKISGLDLSLQQNVDIAKSVFQPILEDESIFKDMVWTKNFNSQMQRAESFRLCTDPEKCGGSFWEPGVSELQYRRQEFMNASPEDAMTFQDVHYTPAFNVMEDAMKKIKDSGFEVKFDEIKNGYIVTTKNGEQILGALQDYLAANYGSDQRVLDYYHTQAYVARKNWVQQNLAQYDGNEDAANSAYAQEWLSKSAMNIKKEKDKATRNHNNAISTQTAMEEVASGGIAPTEGYFTKLWNNTVDNVAITQESLNVANSADATVKATGLNIGNKKVFDESFDRQMASDMMYKELGNVAYAYQQLTQGRELKADPFALEGQRHANQLERIHLEKGYYDPRTKEFTPGLDAKNAEYKLRREQEIKNEMVDQMIDLDPMFTSNMIGSANFDTNAKIVNQLRSAKVALGPEDVLGTSTEDPNLAARSNKQVVREQYQTMLDKERTLGHEYFYELRNRYNNKETSLESQKVLLNAIVDKTGIDFNVQAFLDGDDSELAKLDRLAKTDKRGSGAWSKIADVIMNDFNPDNKTEYGLISNHAMSDYWEIKSPEYTELLKARRDFDDIVADVKDQSMHTVDAIQAGLQSKEPWTLPGLDRTHYDFVREREEGIAEVYKQQDLLKSDLLGYLVSNSKSGLFPGKSEQETLIREWAKTQSDKPGSWFSKLNIQSRKRYPDIEEGDVKIGEGLYINPRSPEQFAAENIDGLYNLFKESYHKYSKSWRRNPELGNYVTSTGETSAPVSFNYNMKYGTNLADNVAALSVLNNWDRTAGQMVQYDNLGKESTNEEANAQARGTLNFIIDQMNNPSTKKGDVQPFGEITYKNIVLGNADYTGGTITPSIETLNDYAVQSGYTKAEDKIAFIEARKDKPINFIIPVKEADNLLYQGSQTSINDWRLANDKPINVNYHKGAGKAIVTSAGENGYNVVFDLKYYTGQGEDGYEYISDNVFIPRSVTLDGDALEQRLSNDLYQLEVMNYMARVNDRKNGFKGDPERVNQMLDQFTQDNNGQRIQQ